MEIILVISMVVTLIGCLMAGFPVAFTLAGVALIFGGLGYAMNPDDMRVMQLLPIRIFDRVIMNELLFAIPAFIAMGVILERSKVAEDLLVSMGQLFGRLRGGLGFSVMIVGTLLAASTGIVGATVVTMGLLSLPTMQKHGYDPALSTGSIAAAGTLGQIIPPSIVLILLTEVISNAWSEAQKSSGSFSVIPVTTGEIFAGALVPGLLLVGLYLSYQIVIALVRPEASPAIRSEKEAGTALPVLGDILAILLPPLVLIVAVLGSILMGVAGPTEAASVGAIGAVILGASRIDARAKLPALIALGLLAILVALTAFADIRKGPETAGLAYWIAIATAIAFIALVGWFLMRLQKAGVLASAMRSTMQVSAMVYAILIGAALFALVFHGLGGGKLVQSALTGLGGGFWGAMLAVMIIMFILGFFLDFIEITFIVVPVVAPVLLAMDGSPGPVWLAIMIAMNLQTSFLTPPFGFALFYLRGVMPDSIPTKTLYRGVTPFVLLQIGLLLVLALFPGLVTWLPNLLRAN